MTSNNEILIEEEEHWPEYITVMKTVRYDIESIRSSLRDFDDKEPSFDDVLEMIHEYAKDDFGCGYNHQVDIRDLIFVDSDGQEY